MEEKKQENKKFLQNKDFVEKDGNPKDIDINQPLDFSHLFQSNYMNDPKSTESLYKTLITNEQKICSLLKTSPGLGIDTSNTQEMNWRKNTYGLNKLPPEKELRIIDFIIECLQDDTLKVLLLSAVISLIIGLIKDGIKTGWIEGSAIFCAVFIVTAISSSLNYNEQLQFQKLNQDNKMKKVLVIRDGIEVEIDDEELLVGDLLILKVGEIISVDGILIGNNSVTTDESAINGESDLIKKTIQFKTDYKNGIQTFSCPILISGTQILEGHGKMLVCAVGNRSFNGRNRELLMKENSNKEEENITPLKKQLNDLADLIGKFGYIMAGLIGTSIILRDIITKIINKQSIFSGTTLDSIINAFILAITVIVVAIPEGLPMAVAISLAYSLGKMKSEKNLVKNLDSSETMGNVNNICTDKTGTLTKGKMVVESLWFKGKDYQVSDIKKLSNSEKEVIFEMIKNNMTVVETKDKDGNMVLNGDMTEKALYYFMKENYLIKNQKNKEINYNNYSNNFSNSNINNMISYNERKKAIFSPLEKQKYVLNFSSDNKFMATLIKENANNYKLLLKGAHEKVVPLLAFIRSGSTVYESFEKYKDSIIDIIKKYSIQSKRILIFASRKVTKKEFDQAENLYKEKNVDFFKHLATDLVFEYIIGIRDQLREEVPKSVALCHRAGITVRMVTGDNIMTALAISKDSGIINENQFNEAIEEMDTYKSFCNKYLKINKNYSMNNLLAENNKDLYKDLNPNNFQSPIALEGEQFRFLSGNLTKNYDPVTHKISSIKLNDIELFKKTTRRLKVISRATPEDKFLLVFGLKQLNNIIAVTGDGTNDAPALKEAHVGFSMGIRGTDIAKEAADILLLDDSFGSIITACKYGRNVYDSIRKFVQFQLTTNIVAVFMTLLGGVILKDSPLNAIQMLWVNLIMDSFASLALATETPTESLLERKPYKRGSSILTNFMKANVVSQGIWQIFILLFILFKGDWLFNVPSDRELEHYEWNDKHGYHFTIFFNIFVFLQVFNSINARKLSQKDLNVFIGIKDNVYYIIVQSIIIIGQIILVTFGGRVVRTQPLTIFQHLLCLIISSFTLVIGYFVKILPIDLSEKEVKDKEEIELEKEEKKIMEERDKRIKEKKKNKNGPNLTLRRSIIPPTRNQKVYYNQINLRNTKTRVDNSRTDSPIIIDRRDLTPNYSSRSLINSNDQSGNKGMDQSNSTIKSISDEKSVEKEKEKNSNYRITNLSRQNIFSDSKEKNKSINTNNASRNNNNNFLEELLDDNKNSDNDYNIKENEKNAKLYIKVNSMNKKIENVKDSKRSGGKGNSNTPRFGFDNKNKIIESFHNEEKNISSNDEKSNVNQDLNTKKEINQKTENLLDNISEESSSNKDTKVNSKVTSERK